MPTKVEAVLVYPPFPGLTQYPDPVDLDRAHDGWYDTIARLLDHGAVDNLVALVRAGPLFDGDVISKAGRDTLLRLDLAVKIVVSGKAMPQVCPPYITPPPLLPTSEIKPGYTWGYQAATYRGACVFRALLALGRVKP